MQKARKLAIILLLLAATCGAMTYAKNRNAGPVLPQGPVNPPVLDKGVLKITAKPVQKKILASRVQTVSCLITLEAEELKTLTSPEQQNVDMVVVLDRSGSMSGKKLKEAKQAVSRLVKSLGPGDRFGLVSYSNGVSRDWPLVRVSPESRENILASIHGIRPGGGTNLGAGLKKGMDLLSRRHESSNTGRLILVSDGRANQGITDPRGLESLASGAVSHEFAISSVGVGYDFNEQLMAGIADSGAGKYYFLENPATFASVFMEEFHQARQVAASNTALHVPLKGMSLVNASGYPFRLKGNTAVIHPGDLVSGQAKTIVLDFSVPPSDASAVELPRVYARYEHKGRKMETRPTKTFLVARAKTRGEVLASLDEKAWKDKVLKDEYGTVMKKVAGYISRGEKEKARAEVRDYEARNTAAACEPHFDRETKKELEAQSAEMEGLIENTFSGEPAEVAQKQRRNSKALQYRGYGLQRGSK